MGSLTPSSALRILAFVASISIIYGSYVVTTPRKWTPGENVQVCVFLEDTSSSTNSIKVVVEDKTENVIIPERVIQVPAGKPDFCDIVRVPSIKSSSGKLKITGTLGGKTLSVKDDITFSSQTSKTFVQTDKFLYKPGQEVQFRIMTLDGPFLKVSTEEYPVVFIETPSGSRIAQWNKVKNPSGLIHESFKLSDEPEEGTYKITVRTPGDGAQMTRTFKVEEYTLPRFEVKINPPKYILGTDTNFIFNVCAKYTYGQPVNGNLTLTVDNGGWGSSKITITKKEQISGCKDMNVTAEEIQLNGDDYYVYSLKVHAKIVEEGTEEEFENEVKVDVQRTALKFKSVGKEEFIKPHLPFTGKVKVEWPNGSPVVGEPMEACAGSNCKTITTGSDGILEFIVPVSDAETIVIKAVNYQRKSSSTSSWRSIMYESSYRHHMKKYFSPSNSSLVIRAPEGQLPCSPDEPKEHVLPVLFSAVDQTKATVTVQVISRGKIQYSKTQEYDLASTELPLSSDHMLTDIIPPPDNFVRGVINVPITLPPTASPSAKVIVWYSRADGEVISDAQEIDVMKCYSNKVSLHWSHSKVQPGEQATLELKAEPESTCSLGVVDKSVELLSNQNDQLTLAKIFELVEQVMIHEWDNAQTDDHEYCRKKSIPPPPPGPPGLPGRPGIPGPMPAPVPVRRERSSPWWRPYYSDYVDALKMFDKSGLYIFTDLTTETRPCVARHNDYYHYEEYDMPMMSPMSGGGDMEMMYDDVQPSLVSVDSMPSPLAGDGGRQDSEVAQERTYFPETWLWMLSNIS